ncbi:MAG: site-specific integrase [Bergeyella sp.]
MITYNFTLAPKENRKGEKSIIISLIKDRKNTSFSIGKTCKEKDWSFETSRVKKSHPNHSNINKFIDRRVKIIDEIVDEYDKNGIFFTLTDLISKIKTTSGQKLTLTYTKFHERVIDDLTKSDKIGTAKVEKDTLNSLQRFFNKKEIGFNEIDYSALKKFETYCVSRGNKQSSVAIRMRTLRSVFNQAIKSQVITEKQYPFKQYKISQLKESGKKEYLNEDEIEQLKAYEPKDEKYAFAKDMFLFSYYSRGINFLDLIKLEKSSLNGERISYVRSKTGVPVSFKTNEYTRDILGKYGSTEDSKYIFNVLNTENPTQVYLKNRSKKVLTYYVNQQLKEIMKELEINKNISYYCARHSFATVLKFNNISIETIREALGQKDIKSTMSYLNTLPDNKLDKIIEDVLK